MTKYRPNIDTTDFDNLLKCFGSLINKVCYFYATDADDFKDLRQEAMINLWRGMENFRGEASQSTWVYRVTLNTCVSSMRKRRRNPSSTADAIENHPELITDDHEHAQMLSEMYTLINRLGTIDKAIILMWLDGNDYETIARVMGISKSNVGVKVNRIKEKLSRMSDK